MATGGELGQLPSTFAKVVLEISSKPMRKIGVGGDSSKSSGE